MSEMDDITRETSRFGTSIAHLLQQLAHATGWLDRRRIKKNINQLVREQTREAEQARAMELRRTTHAIEGYRRHAAQVSDRAADTGRSTEDRTRDRNSLAQHYGHVQERVLRSEFLRPVERGIALDGLAAATTFPEYELGNLFGKARKVTGIDALRYRAQAARAYTETGIARPPAYTRPARRDRATAVQDIRRAVWVTGHGADRDEREATRAAAARRAHDAGLTDHEINREFETAADNARFEVRMQTRDREGHAHNMFGLHPTEAAAAEWAQRQAESPHFRDAHHLGVGISARGQREQLFTAAGSPGFVADELSAYRDQLRRDRGPTSTQPATAPTPPPTRESDGQRLAEVERQLAELRSDRDKLARDVGVLQRGMDAMTADRDGYARRLGEADAVITTLKNANTRQGAELKDLREKVIQTGVERDKFKTERDQAVQKLAKRTPEHQRYGSSERIAAEKFRRGHETGPASASAAAAEQSGPAKRYSVYVGRVDVAELMRQHGVAYPDDLPDDIRPGSRDFDSEHDAQQWARRYVAAMDTGGADIEVGVLDMHKEVGSRLRNETRGTRDGVLKTVEGWSAGRVDHRDTTKLTQEGHTPPVNGAGQQRPRPERSR
ncbi:hypothetical protein [Nocardia huaxiensis]|uniref:hypothetical protein n=1 Tax=Nocardia huaxiensis TaxID=2755382 RepID=UPI001E61C2B2|nr:hypothetical protein [Nocardia huaxiensis]UFS99097.1 hypothetical protein LPY97_14960 [Nocardia huaxiensis]